MQYINGSTLEPKDWDWRLEDASLVRVMATIKNLPQMSWSRQDDATVEWRKKIRSVETELIVEAQNDTEDRFDNSIFDNIFS